MKLSLQAAVKSAGMQQESTCRIGTSEKNLASKKGIQSKSEITKNGLVLYLQEEGVSTPSSVTKYAFEIALRDLSELHGITSVLFYFKSKLSDEEKNDLPIRMSSFLQRTSKKDEEGQPEDQILDVKLAALLNRPARLAQLARPPSSQMRLWFHPTMTVHF